MNQADVDYWLNGEILKYQIPILHNPMQSLKEQCAKEAMLLSEEMVSDCDCYVCYDQNKKIIDHIVSNTIDKTLASAIEIATCVDADYQGEDYRKGFNETKAKTVKALKQLNTK